MDKTTKNNKTDFLIPALILSLTLGLAPFSPEPHLLGKIRWIMGGSEGMQPADYFDFLLHGTPWVLLIIAVVLKVKNSSKPS